MRRRLVLVVTALALAACTSADVVGPPSGLGAPGALRYTLEPSGDPAAPEGILLRWDASTDTRVANYVVYSRASTTNAWSRRAETTSPSFHDTGSPDLQYYVTAQDAGGGESARSNVITVDEGNRLPTPGALATVTLNRAIQLSWSPNARQGNPTRFSYYRVYSTAYDLDAAGCDNLHWVLEGTTVSEDFLATGLTNGVPRCFAVSTVSRDGHESAFTQPRADTPRYDSRNVLIYTYQRSPGSSGFRFYMASTSQFGLVTTGDRSDIDFRLEGRLDGSVFIVPVRAGTRVALGSPTPVTDLTSIGDAPPDNTFTTAAIEAVPGYLYAFISSQSDGSHYSALRVTHVAAEYMIFDWSYQSDHGNPMLNRVPAMPASR